MYQVKLSFIDKEEFDDACKLIRTALSTENYKEISHYDLIRLSEKLVDNDYEQKAVDNWDDEV